MRQQLADLEARGVLPLAAFRQAAESIERLQQWANDTLKELAPDFSHLRQLLTLLPGAVQTTTAELPQQSVQLPTQEIVVANGDTPSRTEDIPLFRVTPDHPVPTSCIPALIHDRNDALERLRIIRRWFELNEPSSPTIPLLRQAERLVGKRFSEVINEIPVELLEKWDPPE